MITKFHYMTPQGYLRLEKELNMLRLVRRKEVARRIHEAIEEGGELEENVAYELAKIEQSFLEGRICEITDTLARAKIVDPGNASGFVRIGGTVVIQIDDCLQETYTIVGRGEIDLRQRRISYESPLGSALIDRKAGDEIRVKTPSGILHVKVLKVD
jgi:transcription elongation factor GreA